MNIEQHLLKVLTNKAGYDGYRSVIDVDSLEGNLQKVVRVLDKLYKRGAEKVELGDLKTVLIAEYPSLKDSAQELLFGLLTNVYNIDDTDVVHGEVIDLYKNKQVGGKLGALSLKYIDDPSKFNIAELEEIVNKYRETEKEDADDTLKEFGLEELLESESNDSGITWPWPEMNPIAGKLKGGILGVIFATPDTGKSAFCHTAATHFAKQCRVLFINNEERAKKVYLRAMCCYTGMKTSEINKDIIVNDGQLVSKRWGEIKHNYIYRDDPNLTISKLKKYIERDEPEVVFIDQATKIKIKDTGRHDLNLTTIFKELREVCKEYGTNIFGVSQADAAAYGVDWLQMKHLANVKIGVQGELDTMIGLSRPKDGQYVNISFPKCKETGRSSDRMVLELRKELSKMYEVS